MVDLQTAQTRKDVESQNPYVDVAKLDLSDHEAAEGGSNAGYE